MPELSIIIPVYNAEKYLRGTVESIIGQIYKEWELLLVDDGSTDSSHALCDALAKQDKRIVVLHKDNAGVSSARNTGLAKATGKFIAFVDADDFLEPDMYAVLMQDLKTNEADIASCSIVTEKEYHPLGKQDTTNVQCFEAPLDMLLNGKFHAGSVWNKIFSRDCLQKLAFNEHIKYSEDQLFLVEALMQAKKVTFNTAKLYHYMQRPGSLSWQDGNYAIWEGNAEARRLVYTMVSGSSENLAVKKYAFEEYGKAVFALFRFAIKYQNEELFRNIKETYVDVLNQYLDTAELDFGKKLEYLSYCHSYKLASLVHYWPKKMLRGGRA